MLAYDGFDLPTGNCTLDGIAIGCGFAQRLLGGEAVVQAPAETTRYNHERGRFEFFSAFADGFAGFLGSGDRYLGGGYVAFTDGMQNRMQQEGFNLGYSQRPGGQRINPSPPTIRPYEGPLPGLPPIYAQHVACDEKLAQIFGGDGAVASARFEPPGLQNADGTLRYPNFPGGFDRGDFGHSATPRNDYRDTSDRGGIIHVYANPEGLPGQTGLYVPAGFRQINSVRVGNRTVRLEAGINNQRYFRNDRLGVTIVFAHVATRGVRLGPPNALGSTQIGNIGGPGGDGDDYFHTHIGFYSEYLGHRFTGTRTDPRSVFCKEFGF